MKDLKLSKRRLAQHHPKFKLGLIRLVAGIVIIATGLPVSSQKMMVVNYDTLPFKYFEIETIIELDTFYREPCPSFMKTEIVNYNMKDKLCRKYGYWQEKEGLNLWAGYYQNDSKNGIWETLEFSSGYYTTELFDNGELLERSKYYKKGGPLCNKSVFAIQGKLKYENFVCWHENRQMSLKEFYNFPPEMIELSLADKESSTYKRGTTVGWNQEGQLILKTDYTDLKNIISIKYSDIGYVQEKILYRSDGHLGTVERYHDNGRLLVTEHYIFAKSDNNTKHGKWIYYKRDGTFDKEMVYKKGVLVK